MVETLELQFSRYTRTKLMFNTHQIFAHKLEKSSASPMRLQGLENEQQPFVLLVVVINVVAVVMTGALVTGG